MVYKVIVDGDVLTKFFTQGAELPEKAYKVKKGLPLGLKFMGAQYISCPDPPAKDGAKQIGLYFGDPESWDLSPARVVSVVYEEIA